MNNFDYQTLTKNLKYSIFSLYTVFSFYLIGFFLFSFSVEVIVIKSIKSNGFVWNNMNLIWIFGLIIMFVAFVWNIVVYYQTLKLQKQVIPYFDKIVILNKYLRKWKHRIKANKNNNWWFLNIFNILVWLKSIKKNIDYIHAHQNNFNNNKDKLQTIVEKYYEQINMKNKQK